jgi:hypothetical protein
MEERPKQRTEKRPYERPHIRRHDLVEMDAAMMMVCKTPTSGNASALGFCSPFGGSGGGPCREIGS